MAPDQQKLEQFMHKLVGDMGASMSAVLALIGDKLGLFKALAQEGPMTPAELAEATATSERYVREWLSHEAAAGYVDYDGKTGRFSMNEEQAMALADEQSPAFLQGAFQVIKSMFQDETKITEAFRSGRGVGWHEHDPNLFAGTERFFRPGYQANLTTAWIPALEGVEEKLRRGARVADVGCGRGASTLIMAKAYPESEFVGFDYHAPSIESAAASAREMGLGDRVRFEVAGAKDFPGQGYDFVAFFDCFHDMGDPAGAASHVREALAEGGTLMLVEPMAGDRLEENLNPVGRVFYGASTMICTPASLSQEIGLALGAQAGEKRLAEILRESGFSRVRRAAQTPFNLILEARP